MNGENSIKSLEIRTPEGALLFTLLIKELSANPPEGNPDKAEKPEIREEGRGKETEPLMTDPQKRYLFRLLAEQGIENDSAYEHLKKKFKVSNLKEVTKSEASKEIERLIAELKEGGESHAH